MLEVLAPVLQVYVPPAGAAVAVIVAEFPLQMVGLFVDKLATPPV
jgi:hypothetical protein